jgi:hypothetical protein
MTSSWHSLIPLLPFLAAANSKDSTQIFSGYGSVLVQLLSSHFQFSNLSCSFKLAPLYIRGMNLKKTRVTCQNAWCWPHRKHRFLCCCEDTFSAPLPSNRNPIVAYTCVVWMRSPSRCLSMGIHVTIPTYMKQAAVSKAWLYLLLVSCLAYYECNMFLRSFDWSATDYTAFYTRRQNFL